MKTGRQIILDYNQQDHQDQSEFVTLPNMIDSAIAEAVLETVKVASVGQELHPKLGEELAGKSKAIEDYADSLYRRIKAGSPLNKGDIETLSCLAFDMGQHIRWHLKHKAIK